VGPNPDAEEDPPQQVAAALLAQEGGDDADDECGFETLAQSDHEGGQHVGPLVLGEAYLRTITH
jgi:hypothetical protein